MGSIPKVTCSPALAEAILLAVRVYLPSGCLGKKAYCPLDAANSRYFPSQTALKRPTLTTLQLVVSPSTSITLA